MVRQIDVDKGAKKKVRFAVSACLIGKHCYYDGRAGHNQDVKDLYERGEAIALCPEELGGLKTPRPPAEIFGGTGEDVLSGKAYAYNKEGKDVSMYYIRGSRLFMQLAGERGVKTAILKARSPCCGKGEIYNGAFTNTLRKGNGVTAACLLKNGFGVVSDEEYSTAKKHSRTVVRKKSKHASHTKQKETRPTTKRRR